MAHPSLTPRLHRSEEAITILFCLVDDAYRILNPRRSGERYASLKRLSDSEVLTLALFQQSFAASRASSPSCARPSVSSRTCSPAWSGCGRPHSTAASASSGAFWSRCGAPSCPNWWANRRPSSSTRRCSRCCAHARSPSRRASTAPPGSVGAPSASTESSSAPHLRLQRGSRLLRTHAGECRRGAPACGATRRGRPRGGGRAEVARRPRLPQRGVGGSPGAGRGVLLVTERADQHGERQRIEICFSSLKRVFRLGETLAKTLVGLATRIAAKIAAYTYGFYVNRLLGRPQGLIKELWA